jgi:peptide chain release factor 2
MESLRNYRGLFDLDTKQKEILSLEKLIEDKDFWNDQKNAQSILKKKVVLEETVDKVISIRHLFSSLYTYKDLALEDKEAEDLLREEFVVLKKEVLLLKQKILLKDEDDFSNAIVTVQSGAGGTEACDWASILLRMILKWIERKKYKVQLLDEQKGDEAGIKSTSFLVSGPFAYGLLKSETGIHRLVRISPFDSGARRHTSFASLYISPEVDDNIEIEILDKDLKIDVYRAGGAGGQSVNTTDSAVRITHLPTNTVVTCQNERSQLQNKLMAMKILRSRLYKMALEEQAAKKNALELQKKEIAWGSQIRSYVLHPYKMVKDHRTNWESSNPDNVLDGDIDDFINAFLEWNIFQ